MCCYETFVFEVCKLIFKFFRKMETRSDFPHQQECLEKIKADHKKGINGVIVAHEMGLGKTRTLLRSIQELMVSDKNWKALVIAPRGTFDDWIQEFSEVFKDKPEETIDLYYGKKRTLSSTARVILTTETTLLYDMKLRPDAEILHKVFDFLGIDEAHQYGNIVPNGPRIHGTEPKYCRLFQKILKRRFTVLLTGTPLKNHHSDVQSLLVLSNIVGGDKRMSMKEVETLFKRHSHLAGAEEMKHKMPTVTHTVIDIEYMSGRQKEHATDLLDKYKGLLAQSECCKRSGTHVSPALFTALMHALSKARVYDSLLTESVANVSVDNYNISENGKMKKMVEQVKACLEEGKKIVVVSYFVTVLKVIANVLDKEVGKPYAMYTGEMNIQDLQASKELFKSPVCDIFLLSKKAGGLGLNLKASKMILFEPGMTPSEDDQAKSRIVRLNQTHKVDIYHYKHSKIDTLIWIGQQRKTAVTSIFVPSKKKSLSTVFNCDAKETQKLIESSRGWAEETRPKKQDRKAGVRLIVSKRKPEENLQRVGVKKQKVSTYISACPVDTISMISSSLSKRVIDTVKKKKRGFRSDIMKGLAREFIKFRKN
jgi:SNF2 family DNA or RNA helicase